MKKNLNMIATILIAVSLVTLFSCEQPTTENEGGNENPTGVALPTFEIGGVAFTNTGSIDAAKNPSNTTLAIECSTDATIRYTLGGKDADVSSVENPTATTGIVYSTPINFSRKDAGTYVIKTIAFKGAKTSAVATITITTVPFMQLTAPIISGDLATLTDNDTRIVITTAEGETGARLFYSIGSVPVVTFDDDDEPVAGTDTLEYTSDINRQTVFAGYEGVSTIKIVATQKGKRTSEIAEATTGILTEEFIFEVDGNTATLTDVKEKDNLITAKIPTMYKGKPVTSFDLSFSHYLKTVIIPETVTSIEDTAFHSCFELESISIPNSVISIGNFAFFNCTKLTTVNIGNKVETIGASAFSTSAVTEIILPDSIKSIESSAFANCKDLATVTIPDSIKSIGHNAFYSCSKLTTVNLGDNITSIGSSAFANSGLTNITIPNSVKSIGSQAFRGCISLTKIEIPNSVTSISDHAFDGCVGLTSITIGDKVETIGDWAFEGCRGLTSVIIPDSVTSIGDYAFSSSGLRSITIPHLVSNIGDMAFIGCDVLETVTIDNSTIAEGIINNSAVGYLVRFATTVYIKDGITTIGAYITTNFTKQATSDKTGYMKYKIK